VSLPSKNRGWATLFSKTLTDNKLIEERKSGLERYLRAILVDKDPRWRDSHAFQQFLMAPTLASSNVGSTSNNRATEFTLASWLEEHAALQDQARSIRALLAKRDTLARSGDTTAAHSTSVDAKKSLATFVHALTRLTKGLDDMGKSGLNEGELRRRSDMLSKLQDELETCSKLANSFKSVSSVPPGQRARDAAENDTSGNRQALLGNAKPSGRVLGKKASANLETAQTRPLDNTGLLQLQQEAVQEQDDRLESITAVIRRQKQLGIAIYNELESQNVMLDELAGDVDRTSGKLDKAKTQLKRL